MATGFSNLAELQQAIGGVPLDRIRMVPPPGSAALADAISADKMSEPICELVDGVLIEKAVGYRESLLAATLIQLLGDFVRKHDLGLLAGADAISEYYAGCVRAPDVSFVSWGRLPGRQVPDNPIPDLVPDLAVEIVSSSNTAAEMDRKLADFKQGGVRVVWLIDPRKEIARCTSETRRRWRSTRPATSTPAMCCPTLS
ncbi:MAG: Uma2 family endonuclease [Planctomycetota bacterium]